MKLELRYHECDKECSFTDTHEQLSNTIDNVTWYFGLPSFDEHVCDWVLSKCLCEDCILFNFFRLWMTDAGGSE